MARSALTASVGELRDYCTTENLVRRWIGRHPWLTLSVASVAGVAVARAVTSLRKAPIVPDVTPEPIDSAPTAEPRVAAATPWWMSLITPMMPMLMSIVEDTIRSAISGKMRGR